MGYYLKYVGIFSWSAYIQVHFQRQQERQNKELPVDTFSTFFFFFCKQKKNHVHSGENNMKTEEFLV